MARHLRERELPPDESHAGSELTIEETDVVVIGAGIAGLATARSLSAAGRDVIVLESRDRVGGRLLSHPTPVGNPNIL